MSLLERYYEAQRREAATDRNSSLSRGFAGELPETTSFAADDLNEDAEDEFTGLGTGGCICLLEKEEEQVSDTDTSSVTSSGASSDKSILTSIAEFLRNGGNGGDKDSPEPISAALISEFLRRTEAELFCWDQEDRESLASQLMDNFPRTEQPQKGTGNLESADRTSRGTLRQRKRRRRSRRAITEEEGGRGTLDTPYDIEEEEKNTYLRLGDEEYSWYGTEASGQPLPAHSEQCAGSAILHANSAIRSRVSAGTTSCRDRRGASSTTRNEWLPPIPELEYLSGCGPQDLAGLSQASHAQLSLEWSMLCQECTDCWTSNDLQLAAELGKTLLERNRELETSLKHHQAIIEDQGQEIEYLSKQTTALKEVNESRLKIYEQLEVSLQEAEMANSRLLEEAAQDRARIKSLSSIVENLEQKCEDLQALLAMQTDHQRDEENRKPAWKRNQGSARDHHTQTLLSGSLNTSLTASDTEEDSPLPLSHTSSTTSSRASPLPHTKVAAQASSGYSSTSRTDSDGFRTDWDRSHSSQEESLELEVVELGSQMERLREERKEEMILRHQLQEQVKRLVRENCYLSSKLEAAPSSTRLASLQQEVQQLAHISGRQLCENCLVEVDFQQDLSFLITSAWMDDNCHGGLTAYHHVQPENGKAENSESQDSDHALPQTQSYSGLTPRIISADSSRPSPQIKSADSSRPAPHIKSADSSCPAPHIKSADSSRPAPQIKSADSSRPAPHIKSADSSHPAPHIKSADSSRPAPHIKSADSSRPAPHIKSADSSRHTPHIKSPDSGCSTQGDAEEEDSKTQDPGQSTLQTKSPSNRINSHELARSAYQITSADSTSCIRSQGQAVLLAGGSGEHGSDEFPTPQGVVAATEDQPRVDLHQDQLIYVEVLNGDVQQCGGEKYQPASSRDLEAENQLREAEDQLIGKVADQQSRGLTPLGEDQLISSEDHAAMTLEEELQLSGHFQMRIEEIEGRERGITSNTPILSIGRSSPWLEVEGCSMEEEENLMGKSHGAGTEDSCSSKEDINECKEEEARYETTSRKQEDNFTENQREECNGNSVYSTEVRTNNYNTLNLNNINRDEGYGLTATKEDDLTDNERDNRAEKDSSIEDDKDCLAYRDKCSDRAAVNQKGSLNQGQKENSVGKQESWWADETNPDDGQEECSNMRVEEGRGYLVSRTEEGTENSNRRVKEERENSSSREEEGKENSSSRKEGGKENSSRRVKKERENSSSIEEEGKENASRRVEDCQIRCHGGNSRYISVGTEADILSFEDREFSCKETQTEQAETTSASIHQIFTQPLQQQLTNGHESTTDYRTIFREMFRVLEEAKEVDNNPTRFLEDYNRNRKQRRKAPRGSGVKPEVEKKGPAGGEDFPSLSVAPSDSREPRVSHSYAAVLRKGLMKDKK